MNQGESLKVITGRKGKMKKVYIAHPLRGNVESNIKSATKICKDLAETGEVIPFSPLHAFGFVSVMGDQTLAMRYCFALLSACDELWVHGDWQKSEGCLMEVKFARDNGIPVKLVAG